MILHIVVWLLSIDNSVVFCRGARTIKNIFHDGFRLISNSQNTSWSLPEAQFLVQHCSTFTAMTYTDPSKLPTGHVRGWYDSDNPAKQLPRILDSKPPSAALNTVTILVQKMEAEPQSNEKRSKIIFLKTILVISIRRVCAMTPPLDRCADFRDSVSRRFSDTTSIFYFYFIFFFLI